MIKAESGMVLHIVHDGRRPKGRRHFFTTLEGKEVNVPFGTTLHFPQGYLWRQYDDRGFGGYGSPPKDLWTVVYMECNGHQAVLQPPCREKIGENSCFDHPAFVAPLSKLRPVGDTLVVELRAVPVMDASLRPIVDPLANPQPA